MDITTYLNQFDRVTKDPSLDTMHWIMKEFGNPHKKCKFIHVAGTNGKGSVCEMITNVLVKAGYRVGKFISPYLIDFKEQVTVNHKPITEDELEDILNPLSEKIERYRKEHEVKWFEITTSIALLYFAKKECDFVVLEAGMGGLNDCTNIVDSDISIITSIGYDHMDVLGNTIDKIATNKAGIVKENSHTICQEDCQGIDIIRKTCREKNTILHEIRKQDIQKLGIKNGYQGLTYQEHAFIWLNLKGEKQLENASCCLTCIDILREKGYDISETAIQEGLHTVIHPGRFELISKEPEMIFDGGHNQQAVLNLMNTIEQYRNHKKRCYIFSILQTKDYQTVLNLLLQDEDAVFLFTDGNDRKRYVAKEELYDFAKRRKEEDSIQKMALKDALEYASKHYSDRLILVVGSFYIYQDVKEMLQERKNKEE